MQERYLGRIEPDLDVCDINGDKLGTVAHVYRYDLATVGTADSGTQPPHEEVIEVKTGLLGLGKHFYLPMSTVQEVTQGCVFLSKPTDEVKGTEAWQQRPPYLDELH